MSERTNNKCVKIECGKDSLLRITDYSSSYEFDKKYKVSLINEHEEVLFATNISDVQLNFEFMYKDYQAEVSRLQTQCNVYKKIIEKFIKRLDVKLKNDDETNN